jgi:hypothetical protein
MHLKREKKNMVLKQFKSNIFETKYEYQSVYGKIIIQHLASYKYSK